MKPLKGGSDIEMPHVPRSIMAWSFGSDRHSQVYLLVGTGNGQLVSLRLNTKRDVIDMSSRRITSLGDQPVRLCAYHVDGKNVVMATGNRTVLLSPKQQRITQHHVNVKVRLICTSAPMQILIMSTEYPKRSRVQYKIVPRQHPFQPSDWPHCCKNCRIRETQGGYCRFSQPLHLLWLRLSRYLSAPISPSPWPIIKKLMHLQLVACVPSHHKRECPTSLQALSSL